MMARRDRVPLLLGHFGGSNAGDEAILDGTCHLLAEIGVDHVRVVARDGHYRPTTTASVRIERVVPSTGAVLGALWSASGVVLCGGTHFDDTFEGTRRLRHCRYLSRYLVLLALARAMGRPVVAIGQGFGPFRHAASRALTRALFAIVAYGCVRDDASFVLAQQLGAHARRWPRTFDTAVAVDHRRRAADTERRALVLAPVCHADADLWAACTAAIEAEWEAVDVDRIEVAAFRGGTREADVAVARELATRLQNLAPSRVTVFDGDVDPLVELLATAKVTLCGRYHALVLAVMAGSVPIVLPVHPKVADAAVLLGIPDSLVVREPTADSVRLAFRAAVDFDARKLQPALDDLRGALVWDRSLLARTAKARP